MSPLPVCFLVCAGLIPMSRARCSVWEVPGSCSEPAVRMSVIPRGVKGVRHQGQSRCVKVVNVKMNFGTEAQGTFSLHGSVGKVSSPSGASQQI